MSSVLGTHPTTAAAGGGRETSNGYGMIPWMANADGMHAATIDEFAKQFDMPNHVNQPFENGV